MKARQHPSTDVDVDVDTRRLPPSNLPVIVTRGTSGRTTTRTRTQRSLARGGDSGGDSGGDGGTLQSTSVAAAAAAAAAPIQLVRPEPTSHSERWDHTNPSSSRRRNRSSPSLRHEAFPNDERSITDTTKRQKEQITRKASLPLLRRHSSNRSSLGVSSLRSPPRDEWNDADADSALRSTQTVTTDHERSLRHRRRRRHHRTGVVVARDSRDDSSVDTVGTCDAKGSADDAGVSPLEVASGSAAGSTVGSAAAADATNPHRFHIQATRQVIQDLNQAHRAIGVASTETSHCNTTNTGSLAHNQSATTILHSAATAACDLVQHDFSYRHDLELLHGIVPALTQLLGVLVVVASSDTTGTSAMIHSCTGSSDTVLTLLRALGRVVCRASPKAVALAIHTQLQPAPVRESNHQASNSSTDSIIFSGGERSRLIPMLVSLWDRWDAGSPTEPLESITVNSTATKQQRRLEITRILHGLSRAPELRPHLARHPDLLALLARQMTIDNTVTANREADRLTCRDYRILGMQTLVNMANSTDVTKRLLYDHEGLLQTILRLGHFDTENSIRHCAATILMEFSSTASSTGSSAMDGTISKSPAGATTVPIPMAMARNATVLGTLVKMLWLDVQSPAVTEAAATTLQNLAYEHDNRSVLVHFRHGVVVEALKQALKTTGVSFTTNSTGASSIEPEFNDWTRLIKVRRRAAGALTNLVCDETIERLGGHKGLLATLAVVCTNSNTISRDKLSITSEVRGETEAKNVRDLKDFQDVQERAFVALTKMASYISVHMDCHADLLDALVVASLRIRETNGAQKCLSMPLSSGVSAVLRVKARSVESRHAMACHRGILDTLCYFCVSSIATTTDRNNAIRALMHLVNDDANREILCRSTSVLTAIVTVAASVGECQNQRHTDERVDKRGNTESEAHSSAILALERLATLTPNRPLMARHPGLLAAVAMAVEREAALQGNCRRDDSGCGEMTPSLCLAKPLLMMLLLAM